MEGKIEVEDSFIRHHWTAIHGMVGNAHGNKKMLINWGEILFLTEKEHT
jgi:hypothetical protein